MTTPVFGLQFIRVDDQAVPVIGANLDVVGIIGPCSSADNNAFPLDTPVYVASNDLVTLAKLGTDGYIMDAINGINDQLSDYQIAAQLVIVVTAYGTSETESVQLQQTIANIMGNSGLGTGLFAFLAAPNTLYCTPRLILAPGYTGQMANSLDTLVSAVAGAGYRPNQLYTVTFGQGEGETNGAQLILPAAHVISDGNGDIDNAQIFIDSFGAWMSVHPTATIVAPDGTPPAAVAATGSLMFSAQPGIGSAVTLNTTPIEFVSSANLGAVPSGPHLTGGLDSSAYATGNIVFNYNPSPGDYIVLAGVTVEFLASGATGTNCDIGINLGATLTALVTLLGTTLSANGALNVVTYNQTGGNELTFVYKTESTASNTSFTTTASVSTRQVSLGENLGATLANFMAYTAATNQIDVVACTYVLAAGTVLLAYGTAGTAGNSYALGSTVFGLSLSGPTLTGGAAEGASTQATFTVTNALGANPIVATATPVLNTLMAHAVFESSGTSMIDDENWRDTISSNRIIPCSGGVKIVDPVSGNVIVMPFAPRVVGAMIAVDYSTGYPFHSAANEPIQGVVGPARTIAFSLVDGSTEGQVLLAANIGILVRGLIGIETAISTGGFVYIGTDTCSADPLWVFYNVSRGRDYIELSLMPALRTYLGRSNITAQTVTNCLNTVKSFLANLTALQQILGYQVNFQGNLNSDEQIRLGQLTIGFQAEEPPVLREITTMSARYAPAIDAMVSQLSAQLNLTA